VADLNEGQEKSVVTITTLADNPHLVPEAVEIAWREWGHSLPEQERERWLRDAARDSRVHLPTSAALLDTRCVAWRESRRA